MTSRGNWGIDGSVSFLPVNVHWNFEGLSADNFSVSYNLPPFSAGALFDIKIDPPGPNEAYIATWVGAGRNRSIGTNIVRDGEGSYRTQGINISVGPSVGNRGGFQLPGPPPPPGFSGPGRGGSAGRSGSAGGRK